MEIPRLPLDTNRSLASIGLTYEDVTFPSRDDNVQLKGWYLPGKKDSAIIIVTGGFQNRIDDNVDTLDLAGDLVKTGYNVLMFDQRGRGESEGKGLTLSHIDQDLGGAVDYLKSRGYLLENIAIIGFCSGAASACIFTSQNDVGALILDGCSATVPNMIIGQAASKGIPKGFPIIFIPGLRLMAKIFFDYSIVNPVDVIGKVKCPILFIHEEKDEFISPEEMKQLLAASTNPANKFWEVSGAKHSQGYKTQPFEYIEKVNSFLDKIRQETVK